MAIVLPFCALRPPGSLCLRVASPPYDVINTREARALAAGNADSFLHVSRAEIDLPDGVDEHSEAVYNRAAQNLAAMQASGSLVRESSPRLYVYAQTFQGRRQVGVVGCVSVDEYDRDVIRKHEKTRADKEDDRTHHIDTLRAHDEPVFLAYRAHKAIDECVGAVTTTTPVYDFTTHDGVGHTLWVMAEEASRALSKEFATVQTLYVADGHHRSAAASRVHAIHKGKPGEHDVFLAVVFPDDQLKIMAYNRLVRDRAGRSSAEILAALGESFVVTPTENPVPEAPRQMCLYVGGRWYLARVKDTLASSVDPVESLDVSLCQSLILARIFGIEDPRRDADVDFVGGIRGTAELVRRVDSEGWHMAISMYPTHIEQLFTVSDAGRLMPPKSTWFEPKLRSGLFVHTF
jgi:uncharacterized protein (DUF1015 family)